jgi:hypothetical protein
MTEPIPIVLFAYNRPDCLRQTLACLRENQAPLIYAFSDGPKTPEAADRVEEVRNILRCIDWCDVILCEREANLGLGVSIRTGVAEVLKEHEMIIVFEDDLICAPGAYDYLCAALRHYKDDHRVMSVTGWTHPRITPKDVGDQPYFDGRAESLCWGTWRRAWKGMDQHDAAGLMKLCRAKGINVYRCGADLVEMARIEHGSNIWAVRFLYHHILNGGLCLRPPWSMVEHIGNDGTNVRVRGEWEWTNPPLKAPPPIPKKWPKPVEHPSCEDLNKAAFGAKPPLWKRCLRPLRPMARTVRNLGNSLGFRR